MMHSQFKKSAYCLVVAALVSACTGNSSSTNVATVIDVDPTTQLAQQTLAELGADLPAADAALSSDTPEGLWLINTSSKFDYEVTDSSDTTNYYQGRQLVLLSALETEGEYRLWACNIDHQLDFTDITLTLADGTLSGSVEDSYNWSLIVTNNRSLSGSLQTDATGDGYSIAQNTRMVGVKVSDATSFTDAASEYAIGVDFTVGSASATFAELSDSLACVGASKGVGAGVVNSNTSISAVNYAEIMTLAGEKAAFSGDASTIGLNVTLVYDNTFSQDIISGQSDIYGEGTCDESDDVCQSTVTYAFEITATSDDQLAFSASGTDENGGEMSLDVSIEAN
jgi:hypothetical protein